MLQEIIVSTHRDKRNTQAIMAIGTDRQPDWDRLTNLGELTNMVQATKQALPATPEGTIAVDSPIWNAFENIYYQRVIKPAFA
jgi:hypothetical protein